LYTELPGLFKNLQDDLDSLQGCPQPSLPRSPPTAAQERHHHWTPLRSPVMHNTSFADVEGQSPQEANDVVSELSYSVIVTQYSTYC